MIKLLLLLLVPLFIVGIVSYTKIQMGEPEFILSVLKGLIPIYIVFLVAVLLAMKSGGTFSKLPLIIFSSIVVFFAIGFVLFITCALGIQPGILGICPN